MAYVTPDKYSPYPRCCDVCGILQTVENMRKLDGQTYVCWRHEGERTAIQLDSLNAHMRIPQMWPNKDAKPQNPEYPNTLEPDEGAAFNLIDRQIQAQCRYEQIESGAAAMASQGGAVKTMAWAGRYLYGLIAQGTRTTMLARARILLAQCADYLLTRQYGSQTGPSPTITRASNAFYGAVLETGATTFVTKDVAAAGQVLLYAYRIFGTKPYLVGARAAASYLRNVQAMGSDGHHFTSSDAGGTVRLYTGSLASEMWLPDDPDDVYSNSLFYPSALIVLEFWNELTTTDGDQTIGATTAVNGFDTAPSELMSVCMADLRACWSTGITDSTSTLIDGLSSTTPREFFNAYPASKPNFNIAGTGLWEFFDGGAATGTQVTAQNFAAALGSLFAYEGASTQVTTILSWLRSFDSNEDFETPDNTSDSVLARSTTGEYDPTICLSTLLTVRDANDSYAAIKINGSSLYDWGAFGLMSRLLANTDMTSFKSARLKPLNWTQRYDDGLPSDAIYDRVELRGQSGLSFQTSFRVTLGTGIGSDGQTQPAGTPSTAMPASTVFYVDGTRLTQSGSNVTAWPDQSTQAQDLDESNAGKEPTAGDALDGVPGVIFPTLSTNPVDPSLNKFLGRSTNLRARDGKAFGINTDEHSERTIIAVIKPKTYNHDYTMQTGGFVASFRQAVNPSTKAFQAVFMMQAFFNFFEPIWEVYSTDGAYGVFHINGPDTAATVYEDRPLLVIWRSSYPSIDVSQNGSDVALTPSSISAGEADGGALLGTDGFVVGNNSLGASSPNFQGTIYSLFVSDEDLDGSDLVDAARFVAKPFPTMQQYIATTAIVNDAVLCAQYATSYRLSS